MHVAVERHGERDDVQARCVDAFRPCRKSVGSIDKAEDSELISSVIQTSGLELVIYLSLFCSPRLLGVQVWHKTAELSLIIQRLW